MFIKGLQYAKQTSTCFLYNTLVNVNITLWDKYF